jgi:putative ABC transport system permease protein
MLIHNLLRHKGRTLMCVVAVAISTALLVSLLSVAEGIWQNASKSIISSREDMIIMPPEPEGGGELGAISNGHKIADEIREDITNISEVSPMFGGLLKIEKYGKANGGTSTDSGQTNSDDDFEVPKYPIVISMGIIPECFKKFLVDGTTYNLDIIELKFTDWFPTAGDPHYQNNFTGPWTKEVLVDDRLANKYQLKLGSKINLSKNTPVTYTVAGIFKTNLEEEFFSNDYFELEGIVILHLSEYQSMADEDIIKIGNRTIVVDNVRTIGIMLNPDRPSEFTIDKIAVELQERYPLLEVLTKEEQLEQLEEQNAMTRVFYTAISLVSIIIGLLFVACIMLISVYERINEIGMLRAIGISRFTIFRWVMLESLLLITIGILIGFLPGYFGSELLGDYISSDIGIEEDLTAFSPELVMWSFIGMVSLGSIMSLIPAIRASIMKVTYAMSFVR